MNRFFLTYLFFLIVLQVYSQESQIRCGIDFPKSVCVSEENNGDITLNWKKAIDNLGLFLKYELYSIESPFIPISTFNNISNTTLSIPNTYKGNNFYIVTTILCNEKQIKFTSDTTKILNINSVKFEEGIQQINWDIDLKLSNNICYIERKKQGSDWKIIDSFSFDKKIYFDTVNICNKNLLNYRLGVKKKDCINYSNIVSDSLQDKYQPKIPRIVTVGFDTSNQNLLINWKKSREQDIQGYIIYQEINRLSSTLDTIMRKNNQIDTFYTIFNPSVKDISNFRLAAFDYCYSNPPKFQTSAQSISSYSTILNYQYDICTNETNLTWNKINTDDEIVSYKIYLKKNNKWKYIDSSVSPSYKLKLEKFTDNIITIQTNLKSGHSFFSNLCTIYSKSPSEPKVSFTNYASVVNDYIEIKHTLTPSSGLKQLGLFKLNEQNEYTEIEKIDANKTEIVFKDYNVFPDKYSYQYYIQHIDSCNNYTKKHKIQKTILLEENLLNDDSLITSILFNNYVGFLGGINNYHIEQSFDGKSFSVIEQILSDSTLLFNYKVENLEIFQGKICFKIKCIENKNIHGIESVSYSNTRCLYFNPKIFIPNSFTPDGKNPLFIPVLNLVKIDSYELIIFNRWGQPVFKTIDINEGWNGKNGLEESPNGLYVYQLKVNDSSGKEIIKRGLINLIR